MSFHSTIGQEFNIFHLGPRGGIFYGGMRLAFIAIFLYSFPLQADINEGGYNSELVTEILLSNPEQDKNLKKDPTKQIIDVRIVAGTFESKEVKVQVISEQGEVLATVPFHAE